MREQAGGKRGRGRPLEFDREAAIRIAVDEFWQRGYQAVSITDLAEAMSITRTSFYNSFGSRDAVFRQALNAYCETAPDRPLREIEPGTPVTPVLMKVFREVCRVRAGTVVGRGCLIVNSIGEIQELDPESQAFLQNAIKFKNRTFQKVLAQAVDQKEIPPLADIEAAGSAFLTFLIGINNVAKVIRCEEELWAICADFLRRYGFAVGDYSE